MPWVDYHHVLYSPNSSKIITFVSRTDLWEAVDTILSTKPKPPSQAQATMSGSNVQHNSSYYYPYSSPTPKRVTAASVSKVYFSFQNDGVFIPSPSPPTFPFIPYDREYQLAVADTVDPVFCHIPKTSGATIRVTINKYGGFNVPHEEACYTAQREKYGDDAFMATYLRHPRRHLYSQFMEIKYSAFGLQFADHNSNFPRTDSDTADFAKWIDFYHDSWNGKTNKDIEISTDFMGTYHPYNLQSRQLSNICGVGSTDKKLMETSVCDQQAVVQVNK